MSQEEMVQMFQKLKDLNKKEEEPLGDGKAVFLEDGTEDEFQEYVQNEERGWGSFINKIKNLNKKND